MANLSFGNIELGLRGSGASHGKPREEAPFRILVIGDFSGRANRGVVERLDGRRPVNVDCDNLDAVLARLRPALALPNAAGELQPIEFSRLDDFHPDRVFAQLPSFGEFRGTRAALHDPATASATAAAWTATAGAPPLASPATAPAESEGSMFERLLGRASAGPAAPAPRATGFDALLREAVAPNVVAAPEPLVGHAAAAVDAAIGDAMRAMLHAPAFQALEATWRGLDFLVRNLESDETLRVQILDASKAELAADLQADALSATACCRLLAEETVGSPGGEPWALVIALHRFAADEDGELLGRIAKIAAAGRTAFVGGGAAGFLDDAKNAPRPEAWNAMRALPEVAHAGLVAPRFLLRLPYGASTDLTETFAFQEIAGEPRPEDFLWGNGALLCAILLGESFRENGWELQAGDRLEVSGLPVYSFTTAGETQVTPCAERWLTDRDADGLLRAGVMPLLSVRGRDAVRLVRFQSLAEPPRGLNGPWS